jgi:hypothetical protein
MQLMENLIVIVPYSGSLAPKRAWKKNGSWIECFKMCSWQNWYGQKTWLGKMVDWVILSKYKNLMVDMFKD